MAEELPEPGLIVSITVSVGTLVARAGIAATSSRARAAERMRLVDMGGPPITMPHSRGILGFYTNLRPSAPLPLTF